MILYGPQKYFIDAEIKRLVVIYDEHRSEYTLRDEGKVGVFIGIIIKKTGISWFHFTYI